MQRLDALTKAVLMTVLLTMAVPLWGQVPDEERVLITDPDILAILGPRAQGAEVYWGLSPEELGLTHLDRELQPMDSGPGPKFTSYDSWSFQGFDSSFTYESDSWGQIWRTGTGGHAELRLEVPDGAMIDWVDIWAHDNHAGSNLNFFLFELCSTGFLTPGLPLLTIIGSASTSGSPGDTVLEMAVGRQVNNSRCLYVLEAGFAAVGDDLRLQKARVEWRRQVSPAPTVATFTDVPTGHPFFQFVEALVHSGVTAGCGGGNFCPNDPLTRGQMAVFLSAALGLSWPQ